MKKKVFTALHLSFFLGLGILLVWWSIHKMPEKDWGDFKQALKNANYFLFVPVFLILGLSHWSRARRWQLLMEPLGNMPGIINTFFAVMIGYLANLAVPRLGEVLKCTILAKYEKVPPEKLVGTIVVERAVDIVALIIVFFVAFIAEADKIGGYAKETYRKYFLKDGSINYGKAILIISVFAVVYLLLRFLFKKYPKTKLIVKIKSIFKGIGDGLKSIRYLKKRKEFVFHSIFIWACYIGGTYLGFYALPETSHLPFMAVFPILAFATIGMILSPGGIGFYPLFIMEVMLLYNVEEGHGYANGTLQWAAQFGIILVVGFICLILLPWHNKKLNIENSISHTS